MLEWLTVSSLQVVKFRSVKNNVYKNVLVDKEMDDDENRR